MSRSHHLANVLQHNARLVLVATRPKLGGHQRLAQLLLAGHPNWLSVQMGAGATTSGELLLQHRIEDDGELGAFVDQQRHRDARMGEAVHEVHGAVDGINDPGRGVRQFGGRAFAGLLFADEAKYVYIKYGIFMGAPERILLCLLKPPIIYR